MEALEEPGTGIVVPQLRSPDGTLEPSLRRTPTLLRAAGLEKTRVSALSERIASPAEYTYPHVVDWAQGAVVLISRECFDKLSGWDESFFLYSEETDFSLRARDARPADPLRAPLGGGAYRRCVRPQRQDPRHADHQPGAPVPAA